MTQGAARPEDSVALSRENPCPATGWESSGSGGLSFHPGVVDTAGMGPNGAGKPEVALAHDAIREALAMRQAEVVVLAARLAEAERRIEQSRRRSQQIRAQTHHPRVDQLHEAIRSRDVIGQAKGILMTTGLSEEEAFDLLRRASQRANLKLRDIAAELVGKDARGRAEEIGPLDRARQASVAMDAYRGALAHLARERAEAIREALRSGMSRSEVARRLGVTPQTITKLLHRFPAT